MESINDYRYKLSQALLCTFSLTCQWLSSLSLIPVYYVSCHIMLSQFTLRPPAATLTLHIVKAKILRKNTLGGLKGWKAIKWSTRSLKLCHPLPHMPAWCCTPTSPLQKKKGHCRYHKLFTPGPRRELYTFKIFTSHWPQSPPILV